MTLGPLSLASILGVPLLLGAALLRAAGVRFAEERVAFLGWAYVAGALSTGVVLFAWILAGGPIDARALAPALLGLAGLLYLLRGRGGEAPPTAPLDPPTVRPKGPAWAEWAFGAVLAAVLLSCLESLAASSVQPIHKGDEADIWAAKAKAIFLAGGFGESFGALAGGVAHADYPLLNPLLQVWVYAHAGAVLHVESRWPIQAFALALTLVVAAGLRRRLGPGLGALLLLQLPALGMSEFLFRKANADLMVALGLVLLLEAAIRRGEEPARRPGLPAVLAGLGAALLLGSKNEGYFYVACALAGLALQRLLRQRGAAAPIAAAGAGSGKRAWAWVLLPLVFAAMHLGVDLAHGFENDLVVGGKTGLSLTERIVVQMRERSAPVAGYLIGEVALSPRSSGCLPVVFVLLAAALPARTLRGPYATASWTLALVLAGYLGIYVASHVDLESHLATSAQRVTFQCLPGVIVWLGAVGGDLLGRSPLFGPVGPAGPGDVAARGTRVS